MKKYLFFLITSVLMLLCNSCKSDNEVNPVWVVPPISMVLYATDGTNNLFDPKFEGNIINKVSITYKEKEYFYNTDSDTSTINLRLANWKDSGDDLIDFSYLIFGYLDGAKNYNNETFIINWPDGSKDTFKYSSSCVYKNNYPYVEASIYLNDESVKKLSIQKVLK